MSRAHRYRDIQQSSFSNATSWRKHLDARLPPLGSRVRVSVTLCGFRGGRNGIWICFSRGFSRFPLPPISFHHFSTLISSISFHFISPCDGASGVVDRHSCYSRTYNIGASSHLIPRPRPCVGHELRIFSSFSKRSVSSPTSKLIIQPFRRFTYVHSSFSNPPFASPTSQALHLIHLASRPCILHHKISEIAKFEIQLL